MDIGGSDGVTLDQPSLAGSTDAADATVQIDDLPKGFEALDPTTVATINLIGAKYCDETVKPEGQEGDPLRAGFIKPINGVIVFSEVVRLKQQTNAYDFMQRIEEVFSGCEGDAYYDADAPTDPKPRIRIIDDRQDPPLAADYVSRTLEPVSGGAIRIVSYFQVGNNIVAIQYAGPRNPPKDFVRNLELAVLYRVAPRQFSKTATIKGHRALPSSNSIPAEIEALSPTSSPPTLAPAPPTRRRPSRPPPPRSPRRDHAVPPPPARPGTRATGDSRRGWLRSQRQPTPDARSGVRRTLMGAAEFAALCEDWAEEVAGLDGLVAGLPERDRQGPDGNFPERHWDTPTPSAGWTIRDQIGHLAGFDGTATTAIVSSEGFLADLERRLAEGDDPIEEFTRRGRMMRGPDVLEWWRNARTGFAGAIATLDPSTRVPWYGPPMSAMSHVSARLMEAWAHGTDVRDALGVETAPTPRLRHVAHLGVGARAFSFAVRGLDVPTEPIDVVLDAPDGTVWRWGPGDAADRVEASALDFCLLVTQRRHRDDVDVRSVGDGAERWLAVAQAFAGAPGEGRAPLSR
ncbi:MAG: TIGR03084 family metal-binding protein [Microthrixaceae bacterium]